MHLDQYQDLKIRHENGTTSVETIEALPPDSYDHRATGTTVPRLYNATKTLLDKCNQFFKEKVNAEMEAHAEHSDDKHHLSGDKIKFYDEEHYDEHNNMKAATTTVRQTSQLIQNINQMCTSTITAMRRTSRMGIMQQLNAPGCQGTRKMFQYLRRNLAPPSAVVQDPSDGSFVFRIDKQHELMIQHWKTVYDKHAGRENT